MNINVLLLHIEKSNLDDAIKSNLSSILDKAINDADTVAELEDQMRERKHNLENKEYSTLERYRIVTEYDLLYRILHRAKPNDP